MANLPINALPAVSEASFQHLSSALTGCFVVSVTLSQPRH